MKITDERLEELLRGQKWIEPSADFTLNVMNRVAMERAMQAERVMQPVRKSAVRKWYERGLMLIPLVLVFGLAAQHAPFVGAFAMDRLREVAFWLGSTTGFPLFAAYPILIVGILAPIFAGAVASCAMSSHCRITRVLTN